MSSAKRVIMYFFIALGGSFVLTLVRGLSMKNFFDCISIVFIILLVITLCKTVRNIGLFDLLIFGEKETGKQLLGRHDTETSVPEPAVPEPVVHEASHSARFAEYRKNRKRADNIKELCCVTCIFFLLALLPVLF